MKTKTTDTATFRTALIGLSMLLAPSLGAAPLLHYELNEGTGTTAFDTGDAPAANGTLTGSGSGWAADSPSGDGSSYSVAGSTSSSYIDAGTVSKLENVGDFSISFWMKLSGVDANDRIFSTRLSSPGPTNGYLDLRSGSSDTANVDLIFEMSAGGTIYTATSTGFDATDWTFVSFVRDADEIQFYLGDTVTSSLVDGGLTTGLSTGTIINQNSGPLQLGATDATTGNRSPDGLLSDFRVYDSALTQTELNGIRAAAIPEPGASGVALGLATLASACLRRRRSNRAARD